MLKTHPRKGTGSGRRKSVASLSRFHGWRLQDAKAKFSEVVRLARESGPQRVTVHGRDAVVVVSAEEFARIYPSATQPSLGELLATSPLRDIEFEQASTEAPVRDVEI